MYYVIVYICIMYIIMCVKIYANIIYVCNYILYRYVTMHVSKFVCKLMYVHVGKPIYVCMYVCIFKHLCKYVCMYVAYASMYVYMNANMYVCIIVLYTEQHI